MTDEELQAIKDRCEDATPGPWWSIKIRDGQDWHEWFQWPYPPMRVGATIYTPQQIRDINFIAHAREDIPALIAEIERLQDELFRARQQGF